MEPNCSDYEGLCMLMPSQTPELEQEMSLRRDATFFFLHYYYILSCEWADNYLWFKKISFVYIHKSRLQNEIRFGGESKAENLTCICFEDITAHICAVWKNAVK